MANHQSSVQYNFADGAYEACRKAHDKLVDLKAATTNEDLQGVYAKSRGYVARVAMIIYALEQAVLVVGTDNTANIPTWMAAIDVSAVEAAEAIMHHLNNQKMIMMGLDSGIYIMFHTCTVKNIAYKYMQTCMHMLT